MTKQDKFYRTLQENFKKRLNESTILTADNITDFVTDIDITQINHNDAPDYSDAFVDSATIDVDGHEREANEQELDWINDNREFVYNKLQDQLY